jgi:hypothetical protein
VQIKYIATKPSFSTTAFATLKLLFSSQLFFIGLKNFFGVGLHLVCLTNPGLSWALWIIKCFKKAMHSEEILKEN